MVEIRHIDPADTTSALMLVAFGREFTCSWQCQIFERNEETMIRFESVPENVFDFTAPLSAVLYNDAELSLDQFISLVHLNVQTNGTIPTGWQRPAEWPAIPDTPNRAYIVWAVFDDEVVNQLRLNIVSGMIVDWGDGTVSNTGGSTRTKSYNYATIDAPVLVSYDGRNYKAVLVSINANGDNPTNFEIHSWANLNLHPNNALEVVDRLTVTTNLKSYRIGYSQGTSVVNVAAKYLERVSLNSRCNSNMQGGFLMMSRCKVFEVPENFLANSIGCEEVFSFAFDQLDNFSINFGNNPAAYALKASGLRYVQSITGGANLIGVCSQSRVIEVQLLQSSLATSLELAFENTQRLIKVTIDVPNATNITSMFRNSTASEVYFNDASAISTTSFAFAQCPNLRKVIMPGLRVGVDLSIKSMQAADINAFFTALGTASGSQVINVSRNPGSSTCDTSIATGKGFTVITA